MYFLLKIIGNQEMLYGSYFLNCVSVHITNKIKENQEEFKLYATRTASSLC
jgi:hypothetical protein